MSFSNVLFDTTSRAPISPVVLERRQIFTADICKSIRPVIPFPPQTLDQNPLYTEEELKEYEQHLLNEENDIKQKSVELQKQREELERKQEELNAQRMGLQQVN